jgi:hypothetical protein
MMRATRPVTYRLRLAALCLAILLAPYASHATVAGALPHPAARATWELILADPYYPDEQLRAVAPTLLNDGYVAAGSGHGRGLGAEGAWVVRFDVNANILWQRTIGVGDTTDINAIMTTSDGDYLLVGTLGVVASPPSRHGWLCKIDDNGNVIWQGTFAAGVDDQLYAAAEDVGGYFVVAGSTVAAGQSHADAWVLKVNTSGLAVWSKTYGDAAGDESARTIVATATSGPNPIPAAYVIAGGRSVNAEQTAWVLKLGSLGAVVWQHTYGNSTDLAFANGIVDTGDGFALTGLRTSLFSANRSAWLFKIDGNGNLLWDHTLSSALQEDGLSLYQTHDGGLVTLGRVNLSAAPLSLRLAKWDAAGGLLWTRVYGRGVDMVGQGVLESGDYGLVIAGSTQPVAAAYGSGTAALFMKVDAQGATGAGCLAQPSPAGTVFTLTSAISTTTALIASAAVTATVDAATIVSGTATTRAFACSYLPLVAR